MHIRGKVLAIERVAALKSRGVYTGREGEMLVCAVHRPEVSKLYHLIYKIDPDASIIVGGCGTDSRIGIHAEYRSGEENICMPLKKEKT